MNLVTAAAKEAERTERRAEFGVNYSVVDQVMPDVLHPDFLIL